LDEVAGRIAEELEENFNAKKRLRQGKERSKITPRIKWINADHSENLTTDDTDGTDGYGIGLGAGPGVPVLGPRSSLLPRVSAMSSAFLGFK
jgi:hypothetical protein